VVYALAFQRPFLYGILAVLVAVALGLAAWTLFKRE